MRGEAFDMVRPDKPGGFVLRRHRLLNGFEVVVGWQINCIRGCYVVVHQLRSILDRSKLFCWIKRLTLGSQEQILKRSSLFLLLLLFLVLHELQLLLCGLVFPSLKNFVLATQIPKICNPLDSVRFSIFNSAEHKV